MLNRVAGSLCVAAALTCFAAANAPDAFAKTPAPAPSASPSPTASPKLKRLTFTAQGFLSATNQQFVGPGTVPPEGAGFATRAQGASALAPSSPYDYASGEPLTTGFGFSEGIRIRPAYQFSPKYRVGVTIDYGTVSGSGNVVNYWGEPLVSQLNPNLGQRQISVPPAFTTHNGQDPVKGGILGIENATIESVDGNTQLRAGWINLRQGEDYVFKAPNVTNEAGSAAWVLPGTVSDGSPSIDAYGTTDPTFRLHGIDFYYKHDIDSVELTDADLPTLPGTPARVTSASFKIDHGEGLTYGAQVTHVVTGGAPVLAQVLYGGIGVPGFTVPAPQGPVPFSLLGGQRNTLFGASASVPLGFSTDVTAKFGYSDYAADGTVFNANTTQGGYYYAKLHHGFSAFDLSAEAVRFEATYAPTQIPYGTLENIFSAQWAYPHNVAPGYYSLADTSMVGPNRQGFRLSGTTELAGVEVRLAYGSYDQIQAYTGANAYQPGFVEPFFTPQLNGFAGLGREQRTAANFAFHPKIFDVSLDFTDAVITRSSLNPGDAVAMEVPAANLTFSRMLNPRLFADIGAGRYALYGSYANSGPANVDLAQNVVYAGIEYASNPKQVYHLQYRLYSTRGSAAGIFGPSDPAFHGPQLLLEQRFSL